jgi:hypothetical protein
MFADSGFLSDACLFFVLAFACFAWLVKKILGSASSSQIKSAAASAAVKKIGGWFK